MNARSTHAPGTWRARKYAEFIEKHGQAQYRRVQAQLPWMPSSTFRSPTRLELSTH